MAGRSGKMDSPEKGRTHIGSRPVKVIRRVGAAGGESRSAVGRGWREGRAALGLRRAGIAPGENGTLRRGMVRGGRVVWSKAPTLKFNATYLVDYHSVGLLWPKLGVLTSITSYSESLSDILYSISIMLPSFMILHTKFTIISYIYIFFCFFSGQSCPKIGANLPQCIRDSIFPILTVLDANMSDGHGSQSRIYDPRRSLDEMRHGSI